MSIVAGNDILATDFVSTSSGAGDSGKVPKLDAGGKLPIDFLRIEESIVAQEDITIGQPVGTSTIASKIARAVRMTPTDWVNVPASLAGSTVVRVISVNTNKYILLYKYTTGTYNYRFVAFTIGNDNVITFGTTTSEHQDDSEFGYDICKLDTDKFAVVHTTSTDPYVIICTVSGTTITEQSDTLLAGKTISKIVCCQLDTNKLGFVSWIGGGTTDYVGIVTVSTYTPTVSVGTDNILPGHLDGADYLCITKIGTEKFVVTDPADGYACVIRNNAGTMQVGSEVLMVAPTSAGSIDDSALVSASTDTFWALFNGKIAYGTVSTVTITVVDTETITGHTAGTLFLNGTDVMEICSATESGMYILTIPSSTIIRTKRFPMSMTSTNGYKAIDDGTLYMAISEKEYHIEGMSPNFIGIAQETVSKGASCKVKLLGKDSNQSGLIPGAIYTPVDGVLTPTISTTEPIRLKALSATEIII